MGTFVKGEKKIRPGIYHRRENAGGASVAGALNGVGAGIFRSNWGPLGKVVEMGPRDDVTAIFGSGKTQDLITLMFMGGISRGLFVRAGTGGTKATATLKDSADAECLVLTAAYVGKREFTATIRDGLAEGVRECLIFEGTALFLKVSFPKGGNEAKALAAALAGKDFNAALKDGYSGEGTLATVVQEAITGGADPTVANADYGTALSVLEPERWNVLCVDTSESAVHALVAAFIRRTYEAGSYPMACLAETAETPLEDRMSHAAAFNDEKIAYVLNSGVDAAGNTCDGYRLAALIGGMVASVPANDTMTQRVVTGMAKLGEALTNTQIEKAIQSGCLVLTENRKKQVQVEAGVNTLITLTAELDEGWKKIRRTKTRFELMDRMDATLAELRVDNNSDGWAAQIAAGQALIDEMAGEKKLKSGTIDLDEDNPAQGDSAWFVIGVDDIDSNERVYLTYRFRYAPES